MTTPHRVEQMQLLALLITFLSFTQPTPGSVERQPEQDPVMKAFEMFKAAVSTSPELADDICASGSTLLFYRAAHFVHDYGKASPADALKAAADVLQVPEVIELGNRLDAGPIETEKRETVTAASDREWINARLETLLMRKDLGAVAPLISDMQLPLPGRVRLAILSEKDREEQLKIRRTILVTALQSYRQSSGALSKLSDDDSKAADLLVRQQVARDYALINETLVKVRGRSMVCKRTKLDSVAKCVLNWVGPALQDLEGAKRLTFAPVENGWAVVDADTGWTFRDPTIGKFSERDIILLQKGLEARSTNAPPMEERSRPQAMPQEAPVRSLKSK